MEYWFVFMFFSTGKTMTNDNNIPIDTTNVIQTPLNVAATDENGVTTVGTNTVSTAAATTTTTLPVGNAADETTRRSLFGAGLYQTGSVPGNTTGPVAVQTPQSVPSMFTQGLMPDKFDGKGFKNVAEEDVVLPHNTQAGQIHPGG